MAANAQAPGKTKISRLVLAALLLIVAVGAALRIHKLDGDSLWLDEASSVKFSRDAPSAIIETTSKDVHPPLYYFALHYWMKLFGDSERGARSLSALFGVLALPLVYLMAAHLFNKSTGLVAALILALSRFHLEFSQEARMYSLLVLLSLLSIYFFLKLLEEKRSRFALALYIITSALMMYTHVYSFFILAAENLYLATLFFVSRDVFRRTWKQWLAAQVTLCLLFLPWVSVQAQQFSRVQQGFWIPKLPPNLLFTTLIIYAGSYQLAWVLLTLLALALFSGWKGWKAKETAALKTKAAEASADTGKEELLQGRLKFYLLLLWLLCPILLPYIVSQFSSPIFLPKYTIAALPAFSILAARGLLSLRFHQLRVVVLVLFVCFSVVMLKNYYAAAKKDLWRVAVAYFKSLARPHDVVLFNDQSGEVPFEYYYRQADIYGKPFPAYDTKVDEQNLAEQLRASVEGHERVWLVLSHPNNLTHLIPPAMEQWYDRKAYINYPGVEMYLFEKRQ